MPVLRHVLKHVPRHVSAHHITKRKGSRGGRLLVQEAEQAETKLDADVKAAQAMEISRPLVVDLTTALAGPWLIL